MPELTPEPRVAHTSWKPTMTHFTLARCGLLVAAFGLFFAAQAQAAPTTYLIVQEGWEGGARVTGQFSGEDLNNDGFINHANGEVSAYQISFSGNAKVPAFTHGLNDLQFFRYTVGTPGFRPSSPLYSFGSTYMYDADDYIIGYPDLSVATQTTQNAQVVALGTTQVAVPGLGENAQFMLAGLIMLIGFSGLVRSRQPT